MTSLPPWPWDNWSVPLANLAAGQTRIETKLDLLLSQGESTMATLDQCLDSVTKAGTKTDSLLALFAGQKQQLADALSGVTLPASVQAKVDAIFTGLEANVAKVDTALTANTTP